MANWFSKLKPGATRHAYRDVRTQHAGKTWTATWHVEGGRLFVASAWGSASEVISDARDPASRATDLLREMVAGRFHKPSRRA
jgi:hypothetical protein